MVSWLIIRTQPSEVVQSGGTMDKSSTSLLSERAFFFQRPLGFCFRRLFAWPLRQEGAVKSYMERLPAFQSREFEDEACSVLEKGQKTERDDFDQLSTITPRS